MAKKLYDADHLTISGKARVDLARVGKGDKVYAVVEATIGAFQDKAFVTQGDQIVAQCQMGEVLVLTEEERDDWKVRLDEQRRKADGGGTGDLLDQNDLRARLVPLKVGRLREICKAQTPPLSQAGGKQDLIQRIIDNLSEEEIVEATG